MNFHTARHRKNTETFCVKHTEMISHTHTDTHTHTHTHWWTQFIYKVKVRQVKCSRRMVSIFVLHEIYPSSIYLPQLPWFFACINLFQSWNKSIYFFKAQFLNKPNQCHRLRISFDPTVTEACDQNQNKMFLAHFVWRKPMGWWKVHRVNWSWSMLLGLLGWRHGGHKMVWRGCPGF